MPAPMSWLRDAAEGSGRAMRAAIGDTQIRLAVTGLSRAGKTVFITSLLGNLLAAGHGQRTLPALDAAAGGRIRAVRLVPAEAETLPRFDGTRHLAALAADPPRWPARTEDLATLALTITVQRASWLGGWLPDRTVTLELLDYPGEWLLDLPMLRQDFSTWSAAALARLRTGPAAAAAAGFLRFVDALPATAPAEEALVAQGFAAYRDLLRALRDGPGLRFLQPGRVLNPGPRGEAPILWFFPLPGAAADSPLGALLRRRFGAYVEDMRTQFFEPYFRRFDRQAVLVDVLGALHAGQAAFDDTAAALAAIAGVLRPEAGWLGRLGQGVDAALGTGLFGAPPRIAFVATKADHVPERQRDALAALLSGLVGASADAAGNLTAMPVAALRCTEDDVVTLGGPLGLGGRTVAAVRGVLPNGKLARVYPGEVPLRPPGAEFWTHELFQMPAFQPPRLNAEGRDGLPHLELDRLLAWLIGDLL